jgi:hypothetical protein
MRKMLLLMRISLKKQSLLGLKLIIVNNQSKKQTKLMSNIPRPYLKTLMNLLLNQKKNKKRDSTLKFNKI